MKNGGVTKSVNLGGNQKAKWPAIIRNGSVSSGSGEMQASAAIMAAMAKCGASAWRREANQWRQRAARGKQARRCALRISKQQLAYQRHHLIMRHNASAKIISAASASAAAESLSGCGKQRKLNRKTIVINNK
jgi:hypothetical protein